jgi:endonuclease/exonuclease/phosphatase family metal-dependent hydrolase
MGDFNAPPGSRELEPISDALTDTWELAGGDPGAVTLSSVLPFAPLEATHLIDRRIDHIFARPGTPGAPLEAERAFVVDAPVDGVHPSDHYAVVVDLNPHP